MQIFIHILLNNIIPLCFMIAIGIILYKAFKLDVKTLSRLNLYLFSPAIIFIMIYESSISMRVLGTVLLFVLILLIVLFLLVEIAVRIQRYNTSLRVAMRNSVLFYNSANYAIPLNQLVFVGDPFTMSIQIIVMMVQSLLPNTFGVYAVNAHRMSGKQLMKVILAFPAIYTIPLAFFMRWQQVPIPEPIYIPLNYLSDAFIAMALLTLGVQLGSMKWQIRLADVMVSNVLRLIISPLVAVGIIWAMGIRGDMAKALVLSSAVPTSLNSILLAVEFDNEPEFASQVAFASTLFSIFTVTIVIYFLKYLP